MGYPISSYGFLDVYIDMDCYGYKLCACKIHRMVSEEKQPFQKFELMVFF